MLLFLLLLLLLFDVFNIDLSGIWSDELVAFAVRHFSLLQTNKNIFFTKDL